MVHSWYKSNRNTQEDLFYTLFPKENSSSIFLRGEVGSREVKIYFNQP